MDITTNRIPSCTIEEFANRHGLEMVVVERKEPIGSPIRYYARFERAEIKTNGMLCNEFGNGENPEEAIMNYAVAIEMKTLVINAYQDDRKEIEVPRLIGSEK